MDPTKEKTFDAVKMTREIRDRHHERFKDKPVEERLAYYREKSQDFRKRMKAKQSKRETAV